MNDTTQMTIEFAKRLLAIPSPSGFAQDAVAFFEREAAALGYASSRTKKGNLIVSVPGKTTRKLGLSGHVDTLGAMVRSVKSNGDLKFTPIGGPIWPTLDGEYCQIRTRDGKIYTGTFLSESPSSHVYKDANTAERTPERMAIRIDEVTTSKPTTEALGIRPGDFVFIDPKTVVTPSGFIKSRFLDDKISVAILYGFLLQLKRLNLTPTPSLEIIISTYEEVGHGASAIPELDEFIAVDMGCIGEDLSCTERMVSICAKDSSGPYDEAVTTKLVRAAQREGLPFAVDIYPMYGSDVSAALRGGNDFRGGLIGPGVHASHGMERTHVDAVEATLRLLLSYVSQESA
jgi:putative aminopeptidase FrvX